MGEPLLLRPHAYLLEAFPWLSAQAIERSRRTSESDYVTISASLDPAASIILLVGKRRTIAAIDFDRPGATQPEPAALDNGTWTDFVGWFSTAQQAYGKFRDQWPCRMEHATDPGGKSDPIPFRANPMTKKVFAGNPNEKALVDDCLWGLLRTNALLFSDPPPETSTPAPHPPFEPILDDGNGNDEDIPF